MSGADSAASRLTDVHLAHRTTAVEAGLHAHGALFHYLVRGEPDYLPCDSREDAVRAAAERAYRGPGGMFGAGITVDGVFHPIEGDLAAEVEAVGRAEGWL